MAEHKINPKPGETWFHPMTFNRYTIHSITDDGWVRYQSSHNDRSLYTHPTLYTQPTLNFIRTYKKWVNTDE